MDNLLYAELQLHKINAIAFALYILNIQSTYSWGSRIIIHTATIKTELEHPTLLAYSYGIQMQRFITAVVFIGLNPCIYGERNRILNTILQVPSFQ